MKCMNLWDKILLILSPGFTAIDMRTEFTLLSISTLSSSLRDMMTGVRINSLLVRTSTSGLLWPSTTCDEKFVRHIAAVSVCRTAFKYGSNALDIISLSPTTQNAAAVYFLYRPRLFTARSNSYPDYCVDVVRFEVEICKINALVQKICRIDPVCGLISEIDLRFRCIWVNLIHLTHKNLECYSHTAFYSLYTLNWYLHNFFRTILNNFKLFYWLNWIKIKTLHDIVIYKYEVSLTLDISIENIQATAVFELATAYGAVSTIFPVVQISTCPE